MSKVCPFGRRRSIAGEGPEAGVGEARALVEGVPGAGEQFLTW